MSNRIFENVKEGDTVSFEYNGMIESGIVYKVNKDTFTLIALQCYDNNGVKSFYNGFFNFKKTGTKGSHRNTYGNAIQITCTY